LCRIGRAAAAPTPDVVTTREEPRAELDRMLVPIDGQS